MIQRCHNENQRDYPLYGAKGIAVCRRWRNSFEAFASDVGVKPTPRHHLNRIDNSKGYSPINCEWVTPQQNQWNTSKSRTWVIDGTAYPSLSVAALHTGLSRSGVSYKCRDQPKLVNATVCAEWGRLVKKNSERAK